MLRGSQRGAGVWLRSPSSRTRADPYRPLDEVGASDPSDAESIGCRISPRWTRPEDLAHRAKPRRLGCALWLRHG